MPVDHAFLITRGGERWIEHFEAELVISRDDMVKALRRADLLSHKPNAPVWTTVILLSKRHAPKSAATSAIAPTPSAIRARPIKKAAIYTNTPPGNNATYQVLNPFNWRPDLLKIAWRPAERDAVSFRSIPDNYVPVDPYGTFNGSALPNTPTKRNRSGCGPQIRYTHSFSSTIINEVKLNAS